MCYNVTSKIDHCRRYSMCKKCYVTTPIYYASGKVQIGNSYTTVACDVYARFNRQMGRKTFYLTGMDEHGQKIEEAALKAKMNPQTFVDKVALETKELWKVMHIDYDGFIRTTDKKHEEIVAKVERTTHMVSAHFCFSSDLLSRWQDALFLRCGHLAIFFFLL